MTVVAGNRKLSIKEQRAAFLSVTGGSKYTADGQTWSDVYAKQRECADSENSNRPAVCLKRGHAQPLGKHKDPEPIDTYTVDNLPSPKTFWERHATFNSGEKGFRPAYFPGLAKTHPAFEKWANDSILSNNYGHYDVKTEPKQEERLSDHCARPDGRGGWMDSRGIRPDWVVPCPKDVKDHRDGRTKLATFMKRFMKEDIYSITQLPDGMSNDVLVPPFIQCGGREPLARIKGREWLTQMYESNLWMSFNRGQNFSKSVLHYDQNHGFMCVYSGVLCFTLFILLSPTMLLPAFALSYQARRSGSSSTR